MNHHKQIDIFIDGVKRYFSHLDEGTRDGVEIGVPYLVRNQDSLGKDYTGVIAVSGSNQGYVFFSAGRSMLSKILLGHGESQFTTEYMSDIVGEITNTIAGNARKSFGDEFHIAPPKVMTGKVNSAMLKKERRSYVLPVRWKSNGAQLIISLES